MTDLDLRFRPSSYWDLPDPVSAIVSGIKGQNRREMARDFVTGRSPAELGEIDPLLLEESLDEPTRAALGAGHPSWMGGEYLPAYLPGEIEVARIVLDSVTRDVISIRARRRHSARRILYRIVDEYAEPDRAPWRCRPASSAAPLALAQMIGLIEGARHPDFAGREGTLPDLLRDTQEGSDLDALVRFVTVESDVYPGLTVHFERQAMAWLERKRREWGDDDNDTEEDDA